MGICFEHVFPCGRKIQYVGMDAEWNPYTRGLRLLQISFMNHVFLVDDLRLMKSVLLYLNRIYKVGCGFRNDLSVFEINFPDLEMDANMMIDIQTVAKTIDPSIRKVGLVSLADVYLNIQLDKEINHNLWKRRVLPPELIEYAINDVNAITQVFHVMLMNVTYEGLRIGTLRS